MKAKDQYPSEQIGWPRRLLATGFLAACLLIAVGVSAFAQQYPTKPITFICPFPVGGGADTLSRNLAQRLSIGFGQPVVVDNRAGAGGTIGTAVIASAAPDGYTIGMGAGSVLTISPHVSSQQRSFDPLKEIAPVSILVESSYLLLVSNEVPAATLKDFIGLLRSQPGKVSYGSAGSGHITHFAFELFKATVQASAQHVPYKGEALLVPDVLAGRIQSYFGSPLDAMALINDKKVRPLAVTSKTRLALLPDVPTFTELGYAEMEAIASRTGIIAPSGTPKPLVDRLNGEVQKAMQQPEMIDFLKRAGLTPAVSSPEEYAAVLARDFKVFGDLARKIELN